MAKVLMASVLASVLAWTVETDPQIHVRPIGKYATGITGLTAAEITAFDPESNRLFSVNAALNTLEILNLSDPATPILVSTVLIASCVPGRPTSVAVRDGLVAVAAENVIDAEPGWVVFFNTDGACLNAVVVGAGPDMVTFTPNGRHVLVANEGEAGVGGDPDGSVAMIRISGGAAPAQSDVTVVGFDAFDKATLDPRIHRVNPSPLVALSIDLEPEYIAVSHDSKTAWVRFRRTTLSQYLISRLNHSRPFFRLVSRITRCRVTRSMRAMLMAGYAYRTGPSLECTNRTESPRSSIAARRSS